MKRRKKACTLIIILSIIIGIFFSSIGKWKVQAAIFGDYEYELLTDDTIIIVKYIGSGNSKIKIPEKIDGRTVTEIGEHAFVDHRELTEISIPDSIINIEGWAFDGCKGLTKIRIPDNVNSIKTCTFQGCNSLTEISLSNSLTSIEGNAFLGCVGLTSIDFPNSLTNIGVGAFLNCENLEILKIPKSVSRIEHAAFNGCKKLNDIYYSGTEEEWGKIIIEEEYNENLLNCLKHFNADLPDNFMKDYEYEILDDDTIKITKYTGDDAVLEIPAQIDNKRVSVIGEEAFYESQNLIQIIIPDGVREIGIYAFQECKSLTEISLPLGLEIIGRGAFLGCKSLTEVILPASVTSIEEYVFKDCMMLTKINIPPKITGMEDGVFYNCHELKEINIPSGMTKIGSFSFSGCESLTKLNLPSGVTSIGDKAFQNCIGLTEFIIPSGVTIIEYGIFSGCIGLSEIGFTQNIEYIKKCAFENCVNLKDIYYSGNQIQWEKVTIESESNESLLNAKIHYNSSLTDEIVNEYEYQILDNDTIEITKYKGTNAMVHIPESLDGKRLTVIGFRAFYECEEITKIVIPDGVTKIAEQAFGVCPDLREVYIPDSIISIEKQAFYGCDNLKDVYYSGTKKQWEQITIDTKGNDELLAAEIHCKEEPPEDNTEEIILPVIVDTKQELERLKSGDPFSLEPNFQHYLSLEQIDILESYLYTWLAGVNYTYQYSGDSGVRDLIRKKSGIDPQGDFASGTEQAITHVVVETKYGTRTFEVTLDLGEPDNSGNLYPSYGAMYFEVLEKGDLPSDLPVSGQIGRGTYTDLGPFTDSVKKASEDSLHQTYQWQSLDHGRTAGVLVDKTVTEIIGNKNGSFSDATFTIYAKPLVKYSKKVTIACPVDVFVYSMDGKEAGSIVDNQPNGVNRNVRLDVNGDTKTVYLTGNDYYLNLRGTDTGTMKYEIEEIANDEVCRNVQFLELQLKKDMQYEGYVFRPLHIDRDLYALRSVDGNSKEVIYADTDSYQPAFKQVQQMSLSQKNGSLDEKSTVQLNASLLPLDASNPNLNWTTDNESVVSVDSNGLVTAIGSGRATVTVSTRDGSFLKQFCIFDVAEQNNNSGGDSDSRPGGDPSGGSPGLPGNPGGSSGGSSGNSGGSSGGSSGNPGGSSGGSSGNPGGSTSSSSGNSGSTGNLTRPGEKPVVVNLHYIIQFDTNGGTNLSRRTMTLLSGDSPGIMPKVQRKDYTFSGWYTQKEGGTRIAGDQPLEEAATLYARWAKAAAPAKTASVKVVSQKKGQARVSFQNVTDAAGYQVEYAASKTFASAKKKEVGANAKAKTLTGLKAGKKYYIRMRAYVLDSMGNRIFGTYSEVKSIRIKA